MGSDTAPLVLFDAVLQIASQLSDPDSLVVFATQSVIDSIQTGLCNKHIEFQLVQEFIEMNDEPIASVKHKKSSSIVIGIRLLKKRKIDAFVSAGNTGALLASATLSLPKLPTITRPALLAVLPTKKGSVAVIDVGGNVSCKASHLVQFAKMGAAYQSCMLDLEHPAIGLLNVGAESKKGTAEVRQAYQILQEGSPQFAFVGNVEGVEVFQGKADVLVTNGFTGNVLLKTTEGVASFIFDTLKGAGVNAPGISKQFDYAEYPGAILCGVDGIVIKCHSYSSSRAMYTSLKGAIHLVRQNFLSQIKSRLTT